MLPVKKNNAVPGLKGAFARAAARYRDSQREAVRFRIRIGFVIDATASRRATWEEAQAIQARMFHAAGRRGAMSLRLVHFGGGVVDDGGWQESPRRIAAAMAKVRCRSGLTQFIPALSAFAGDGTETNAKAIIMIGDAFEEDSETAMRIGAALRAADIRVFAFLEGEDRHAADIFRRLAQTTGGRFARFGDELPLDALCQGVALLSAGGRDGLAKLGNEKVRQLLLEGPKTRTGDDE